MKNRYFNGMRNRKLDRGKLNLNKKIKNMPCMIMMITRAFFMFGWLYGLKESEGD